MHSHLDVEAQPPEPSKARDPSYKSELEEAQAKYLADLERDNEAARVPPAVATPAAAHPLGFWKIAFAVMAGNLMTAAIGAFVYAAFSAH